MALLACLTSRCIRAERLAPKNLGHRILAWLALLSLGIFLFPLTVDAEESSQVLEQRVKAAFLFKFAGYVDWPDNLFPSKDTPLVIGVAGADLLADELSQVIAGRTMNGRPVLVKRIGKGEPLANLHILFVGRSELARLNERVTQNRPILTVSDTDNGLAQGSVINFIIVDKRVRFEISLETAKRNGLKIGAPLLSVALHVQD